MEVYECYVNTEDLSMSWWENLCLPSAIKYGG